MSIDDDIVAVGGKLSPELVVEAYRNGVFPWPDPDFPEMIWASPLQRAVLDFTDLHLSRSLKRFLNQHPFDLTIDRAFAEVLKACATVKRPGQKGTWITSEMAEVYQKLHEQGIAHSIEVWSPNRELVGGVYGVEIDGTFSGESMFHLKPNASKLALVHLIRHLHARGLDWMDVQQLTPHLEALGAKVIPRAQFLKRLFATRASGRVLF